LSGRGLCDELITRPEESYRLWCVVVCDLETSRVGAPYIYDISRLRVKQVMSSSLRLATYTTHNRPKRRTPVPTTGFEPAIPAFKSLLIYTSDRTTTGIGIILYKCGGLLNLHAWVKTSFWRINSILLIWSISCICKLLVLLFGMWPTIDNSSRLVSGAISFGVQCLRNVAHCFLSDAECHPSRIETSAILHCEPQIFPTPF